MRRKRQLSLLLFVVAVGLCQAPAARAQFGGRAGDVVLYALTAKGSGDFRVPPPGATNDARTLADFKVISLDAVPLSSGDPFPIQRQVLYEREDELFQVGTDPETTVGLHRIFVAPTKIFVFQGVNNPIRNLLGNTTNYLAFPVGMDLEGDVALLSLKVITWVPQKWPFIVLTDRRGPLGPPDISGFEYFFQLPGAVTLPSLLPWTNMWRLYPGGGWPNGVDLKLLETDTRVGNTTRLIRIRPGKRTPVFRIPGHTHLFVLQGGGDISPAGSTTVSLKKNDYAFLPENFVITLSNPKSYAGPGAP